MITLCNVINSKMLSNSSFFQTTSSYLHFLSKIFPPVRIETSSLAGKSSSYQLMLDNGIIFPQSNGMYTLLPLGLRSVDKLISLVDRKMKKIDCQKLCLPFLTNASLWEKSGRLAKAEAEVMRVKDRNQQEYVLSPTHEEAITYLVSTLKYLSDSNLPIRLYQITSKFRDEMRLKHGLMRSREFLMKDLYTFDGDIASAQETFNTVCQVYEDIFRSLKVPIIRVLASVGSIGGEKSCEFHIQNSIGEDAVLLCPNCHYAINSELCLNTSKCPNCENIELNQVNGIEVGHSFLLGTKYSACLSADYKSSLHGKSLLQMGCYGLGITRILAAGIEALTQNNQIIWPSSICPFKVCLIPPKKGSKEASSSTWCDHLQYIIAQIPGYEDEVIVDDRTNLSIGQRLLWAKKFGFPLIIIVGKSACSFVPRFELINTKTNEKEELTQCSLLQYIKEVKEF